MSRPENARPAEKIARTDNDFPISWIKTEGAGRVFYSSLGHNKDIFNVPSILQHFLDGIQFALGDLAADAIPSARLPATPKPALAPDNKTTLQELALHLADNEDDATATTPAAAAAVTKVAAPVTDFLAKIANYDYGQDTSAIVSLQTALRGQSPAERAANEAKIVALLAADGTSVAAKQELIRCLLLTSTAAAVPALEKIAATEALAPDAARALAGIADPSADAALLRLAANAPADSRATFINALAQRRSAAAVNTLASIAKNAPAAAESDAALEALARIGTPEALAALTALPLEGTQAESRTRALLAAADTALRRAPDANRKAVAKLARSVLSTTKLVPYRIEAAQILLAAAGKTAVAELLPLTRDPALRVRQSVARSLALSGLPAAIVGLDAAFASLPPDTQAAVVSAAYDVGSPALMPLVKTALAAGDASVRPIAARAAGRCGDDTTIDLLLPLLNAAPDLAAAAKEGLGLLPSGKTDKALLDKLARAETPAAKVALLTILAGRQQRAVFPDAVALCAQTDATVRASAFESVAKLARAEDFPLILTLTPKIQKSSDRRDWRKALFAAASAQPKDGKAIALIQEALSKPDAAERTVLIGVLTVIPGDDATKVLRSMLASPDAEVRKDIIRALAAARSEGAYALLKESAKNSKDSSEQILALRGYLDTLAALENLKPSQRVEGYRTAWTLASRQEEKDAILAAVKQIKGKDSEKFLKEFSPPEPKPDAKA
jgi:HEAT repeat protein